MNLKNHVVPETDAQAPESQDFEEAAIVSIMAAAVVESDLGGEAAENMSVPSQELPVNAEPEEPVTHEEEVPVSSTSLELPEVTVETEPEPDSTNSTSEDKVSTLEMEEQHALSSPESREAANIELNDDIAPIAAAETGPEVMAAVVAPVLETSELQAQHSVEETTEVSFIHIPSAGSLADCNKIIKEDHIVEAAGETEFIAPNEGELALAVEVLLTNSQQDSVIEPVKAQLEIPEAGESDRTAEVEPMEESPAQIEEDRVVLTALQVRQLYHPSSYLLTVKLFRMTLPCLKQSTQNLSTLNLIQ